MNTVDEARESHTKPNAWRPARRSSISFDPEEGLTRQSMKDECNINLIMAKYIKAGAIEHVNRYGPQYFDCSSIDLQQALGIIEDAEDMFAALPAALRREFNNDPGEFLDFVQDPENTERAVQLGLLNPVPVPEAPPEPQPTPAEAG